jgi:hypothetical protein
MPSNAVSTTLKRERKKHRNPMLVSRGIQEGLNEIAIRPAKINRITQLTLARTKTSSILLAKASALSEASAL